MAPQTGRTVSKHISVHIDDVGGTLREIPVDEINGLGLTYAEAEYAAFMDAIRGILLAHPDFTCVIGGPWENTANTGSHTVLAGVNGGNTPLAFDVRVGVRHAWESGEPQFGITGTSANGVLVSDYQVVPGATEVRYTARIRMASGSAAPAWGTAAET